MKHLFFLALLMASGLSHAVDAKDEWNGTSLTEATIHKIQQAQFQYKKCVGVEMQKSDYAKLDSRHATDAITKQCEPELAKMRQVYLAANVPEVIADRHLKKMRIEITRRVLKQMMFTEAARATGQ